MRLLPRANERLETTCSACALDEFRYSTGSLTPLLLGLQVQERLGQLTKVVLVVRCARVIVLRRRS
jgi:hypothetical protein